MNKKRKYTDEELIKAIRESFSIREVLGKLGKSKQGGGSYNQVKSDVIRLNLDKSHFKGKGHLKGQSHNWATRIPLNEIMIKNSTYTNRTYLKNRLMKEGLLKDECYECGLAGEWNKKKLIMVLDHINGINNDNRLENLRMLCPNCNSQQNTFAGRNRQEA